MIETILSPEHTLEQLQSGELLNLPDLSDPNVRDPNESVFSQTGIAPGLVNTRLFFEKTAPEIIASFAPDQVAKSFFNLQKELQLNPLLKPADVLLKPALYQDYLKLTIFLTSGKAASFNDIAPHLKLLKQLNLSAEDKLVTFPAAIIGFALTERGGNHDGVNHISNYQTFLDQLISGTVAGVFSPLCAQYDAKVQPNGSIINYQVAEHLAESHTARTIAWVKMLTFVSKLKNPEFISLWSTLTGDADHIGSIVPRVISYHAQRQEIARMFLRIDRHFCQLESLLERTNSGIVLTNLTGIENFVDQTLEQLFGAAWQSITENNLYQLISFLEDKKRTEGLTQEEQTKLQLLFITQDQAYPTIRRFIDENRNLRQLLIQLQNLDDDLATLTFKEWQEWAAYQHFDMNRPETGAGQFLTAIKERVIKQGQVTAAADALHEVILYFCLGAYAAQNNLAVIGLDIDHDPYMSLAWESGWLNSQRTGRTQKYAPIVYARNPDTGKADTKYSGMSYGELYQQCRQTNKDGLQPISAIPLREPWFEFK